MTSIAQQPQVDRELAALLITLAPLGERGRSYVDTRSREFHADDMLDGGWSTGERWLILCARSLWRGVPEKIDLSYVATLDRAFFGAVMNGIAAYRGQDFITNWTHALEAFVVTAPEPRPVGAHRAPETTVERPRTKYQPKRYRPELDPATAAAMPAVRPVDGYMVRAMLRILDGKTAS